MYADWHELARLLADHPDIIIAKMDTDTNEKDPYYLPETYVPNIKLFKKNEKRNYVPYRTGERNVAGFVEFLARETGLDLGGLLRTKYPAYRARPQVEALLNCTATVLYEYQPARPTVFLAAYYADPGAFPVPRRMDSVPSQTISRVASVAGALGATEALWNPDIITVMLALVEEGLAAALPEKPERYLAAHFMPKEVLVSDVHRSPNGFHALALDGIEPLSRRATFEAWPDVTRAISNFKVLQRFLLVSFT